MKEESIDMGENNFNVNVSIEALIHDQMEKIAKYYADEHKIAITNVTFRWVPSIRSNTGILTAIEVTTQKIK